MDPNLWRGELEISNSAGEIIASGAGRIEAILNPEGTWQGTLLAGHDGLEMLPERHTLTSPEDGWTALIEPTGCAPSGNGHGTVVAFRGLSAWPV